MPKEIVITTTTAHIREIATKVAEHMDNWRPCCLSIGGEWITYDAAWNRELNCFLDQLLEEHEESKKA
jgi:hypothetical protein